jgi:hypothetical protein
MTVLNLRVVAPCLLLSMAASACASNRYVSKNRGAPEYDVTIVNNCTRLTVKLWFDNEYRSRHKIDVRARRIAGRPETYRLPAGKHSYHLEWDDVSAIRVREGTFVVQGVETFSMC